MDKLSAMRAYVQVVDSGTFTKAAKMLGLPKPTVTRLIQALEAQLRTKLLHRTTRRVSSTADGTAYYERARRLLGELDDLELSFASAAAQPSGTLRVDMPSAVARLLFVPALPAFHARYPDIQLRLGVSDGLGDLISQNIDCVLHIGEISDPSLVARRVTEFTLVPVATPSYLRRHGRPQHPHDLEGSRHHVIGHEDGSGLRGRAWAFERESDTARVSPNITHGVNDGSVLLEMCRADLGIALLPLFLAQPDCDAGALVPLLTDWRVPATPMYAVYVPGRHMRAQTRAFIDWAIDLFARRSPPVVAPTYQPAKRLELVA